jgi:hypothetical protein
MFGTLTSKVFYIQTKKMRKIRNIIVHEFNSGFTLGAFIFSKSKNSSYKNL